jgi:hypothetical protein
MDINHIAEVLADLVKDDSVRTEIYTRILEDMDQWDIGEIEEGVDPVLDALVEDMHSDEEEEEFEEDEDYDDDDEDSSADWDSTDSE